MNIFFSIIIPVYNSEKHLVKCIKSVLNQKCSNLEIIIIDDKSKDKSVKIIKLFAKKYANIKFILNKNHVGVSKCRNQGISKAIGKYILFLDSDDYLLNNVLKKLKHFVQLNNGVNLVIFNFFIIKTKNIFIKSKKISFHNSLKYKLKDLFNFLNNNHCHPFCWSYLFERNFLTEEKIKFEKNINMGEDRLFVYKALSCINKYILYKEPIYCYNLSGELSKRKQTESFSVCVNYIKIINKMIVLTLKKNQQSIIKKFIFNEIKVPLTEIIPLLILISHNDLIKLSKIIQKNIKIFKLLKIISKKQSMYFFIMKYGPQHGLINYRNFIIEKIAYLSKNFKSKEIYIFSYTIYAIAIAKIFLKSGYPVKCFIDNDNKYYKNRLLDLKVTSPAILSKKTKKELSKILVIISNQTKPIQQSIILNLKKINLNKKQIITRDFSKLI